MPRQDDMERRLREAEALAVLWEARYRRLMGWVKWLRDDVCGFKDRPFSRCSWQGLNREVGTEDLFMASLEIEAEVLGDHVGVVCLGDSKDQQFRGMALQAARGSSAEGKPQGEDAPDA